MERAESMLQQAEKIKSRAFVTPKVRTIAGLILYTSTFETLRFELQDVVNGQERLNLAFVANLFNNHAALDIPEQSIEELNLDVIEETREEKVR